MAMQSGFIKRIRDIMRMDAGINGDAQRIEQMVWMLFLDGDGLMRLMIQNNIGGSLEEVYEIKRIDNDFFEDFE